MRARIHWAPTAVLALMACAAGNPPLLSGQQASKKHVFTNDDLSAPRSNSADKGRQTILAAPPDKGAPFVTTPMSVVDRMLETAGVTSADTVFDLGSGDGRIVLRAAQRFGARAVGVEIDPGLVKVSKDKAQEMKLEKQATFIEGDVFRTDVTPATVVAIYLVPEMLEKLRPIFQEQLRAGARVVVHQFPIPGWQAASTEEMMIDNVSHPVFLYKIPEAFRPGSKD